MLDKHFFSTNHTKRISRCSALVDFNVVMQWTTVYRTRTTSGKSVFNVRYASCEANFSSAHVKEPKMGSFKPFSICASLCWIWTIQFLVICCCKSSPIFLNLATCLMWSLATMKAVIVILRVFNQHVAILFCFWNGLNRNIYYTTTVVVSTQQLLNTTKVFSERLLTLRMHSNTSLVVLTVTKHLYSFNCSMYSVIQQSLSNSSIRYFPAEFLSLCACLFV